MGFISKHRFYFIILAIFFVWMLFIDSNDLFSQLKLYFTNKELENKKEYYEGRIEEMNEEK